MAITENTRLYEILVRVKENEPYGVQLQTITEIKRDGETISASTNPPVPVTAGDAEALSILQSLIGDVATAALTQNQALSARVSELEQQLAQMEQAASEPVAEGAPSEI